MAGCKKSHNTCMYVRMYMGLHLNSRSRPHARRERLNAGIPLTCFLAERPYHTSLKDMAGYKNSSLDTCRLGPQQVPKSPPRPHAGGVKKTSCWIVQNGHLPWVGVGSHYPAPVPSPAVQDSGLNRNVHCHLKLQGPLIFEYKPHNHSHGTGIRVGPFARPKIYLLPVDTGCCSPVETCCCVDTLGPQGAPPSPPSSLPPPHPSTGPH